MADFRYDEGIRIREDFVCPTLLANGQRNTEGLSATIYIIEVTDEENSTDTD